MDGGRFTLLNMVPVVLFRRGEWVARVAFPDKSKPAVSARSTFLFIMAGVGLSVLLTVLCSSNGFGQSVQQSGTVGVCLILVHSPSESFGTIPKDPETECALILKKRHPEAVLGKIRVMGTVTDQMTDKDALAMYRRDKTQDKQAKLGESVDVAEFKTTTGQKAWAVFFK